VGVLAHPFVVTEPTIERLVDHVDHIASVVGIEHAGLGGDLTAQIVKSGAVTRAPLGLLPAGMPLDASIQGLAGPEDYPALVAALRARGYDGDRLDAVLAGNWLRVLRRALPA